MKGLLSDAFPASAWRWGDGYLLEPGRRRLTRHGESVDVEDRAFDLVVLLLQHHERALDRQEVIAEIWNKRPVSDATLRQLVYKARRAVGDDGNHQAVISTLYGRSLQWIAPVEMVLPADEERRESEPGPALDSAAGGTSPVAVPIAVPVVAAVRWKIWAGVAVVLLAGAGAWTGMRVMHGKAATATHASPRVAIMPIQNATGDASYDWVGNGLPGLLGGLMGQGGDIDVVDVSAVASAAGSKPTQGRSQAQQVRFVTGSDILVSGRLRKLSAKIYELDLRVAPASGAAADIVLSGAQPAQLAVDVAPRIRAQMGLGKPRAVVGQLPHDPLLAEVFARGIDLQARGKIADSISYFKLCVAQAPDFLPCLYRLGIGQLGIGDSKAGGGTLQALLPLATRQDDPLLVARALLMLADNARLTSSTTSALAYLRKALPFAQRSGDMETEAQIQLMTAITAHSAHDVKLSAQAMAAAEALLQRNPDMRLAREMLYQARFSIAGEGSNPEDAIEPARAFLAMAEEDGNESSAVTALDHLAVALRAAHHTGEAITVNARALQRAHADGFAMNEAIDAGNLALALVSAGLPEVAGTFGDRQYELSKMANDAQTQAIALLIDMTADLQVMSGTRALARLKRGDSLAWGSLDPELVLDRSLYEAMAAYLADPSALRTLQRRVDAYHAGHELAPGLLNRVHFVHALAAAANGDTDAADEALKAAVASGHLDDDGDLELRMVPMLVALHNHDAKAATLALDGYDPANTNDAAILRVYAQWMRQTGDVNSAQRAEARLAQLQKQGLDALASAGFDPKEPLGGTVASAAGSNN